MIHRNKTERETYLNRLTRGRIKSALSLAVLMNLDQIAQAKGSYFSERFKL